MTNSTDNLGSQQSVKNETADHDEAASIDENHPLESVVENLQETAEEDDDGQLSVGEMVDAFGRRSYGPLMAAPALIALIPVVGAIPGVSIVTGTVILLVSIQMLIWNEGIWLPERLRNLSIKSKKVAKGAKKSKPWVSWSDGFIAPRFKAFGKPPLSYITPVICILLAISMFPLAFVPMGVAPPAAAILLLSLGIIASDGVLLLLGYLGAAACAGFAWYMLG